MIRIAALMVMVGCGFSTKVPDEKMGSPDASEVTSSTGTPDAAVPTDAAVDAVDAPRVCDHLRDKGCPKHP